MNRIDRVPTLAARWVGAILSALLGLVFLPAAALVYFEAQDAKQDQAVLTIIAYVLALIGLVGALLLYRFVFTAPRAASTRSNQVWRKLSVTIALLVLITQYIRPTPLILSLVGVGLFLAVLWACVSTRNPKVSAKSNTEDAGAP
jgi:uncharacterized membrane protein